MTSDHQDRPETPLAEVVQMSDRHSAHQAGDELEPAGEVLEGELVTPEQYAARQRQLRDLRYAEYRRTAVAVVRVTRTAVTHDHTKATGRALVRHGSYIGGGAAIVVQRIWTAQTNSRYERILNTLEAKQDWDRLDQWECKAAQEKQRRHQRRIDWLQAPGKIAKAGAISVGTLTAVLLALGFVLAVASKDPSQILGPLMGIVDAIRWTYWLIISWGVLLVTGAASLGLYLLWRVGRAAEKAPDWAMPANRRAHGEGAPVTPDRVINALCHLGIADMRKAVKELPNGGAELLSSIALAGCGVEVDVRLPQCSTDTGDIQKRRRKLAELLDRHEHEVFITIPKAARTVRLWIADPGALDEPIEASPLVTSPPKQVSMYRDRAPLGLNLRGDVVATDLWQKHLLITGLSNMGKTAVLRALALWLLFDPTVEFRLADLKGLGDWRMFRGTATTYIEGPSDDHSIAATHMLESGVAEMEKRLTSFDADKYPDGVPPGLAGYHPIVLIVDEAQNAFMNPEKDEDKIPFGGRSNNSRFFKACRKILNQGRAVNVVLWLGTQDPTNENLPKLVREAFHVRMSLKVGSPEQSRMALGDAAVNDGAAPHELQQEHKGTVVITGPGVPYQQGQTSEITRTHYINGSDGAEIAELAKELRVSPIRAGATEREPRDHLVDIGRVVGESQQPRVGTTEVLHRLKNLDEVEYRPWTHERLTAFLKPLHAAPYKSGGVMVVSAARVQEALTDRDENGGFGGGSDDFED